MATQITINLKFYSGVHRELNIEDYNPSEGLTITPASGTRLKKILTQLGIKNLSSLAYFRGGERIGLWSKVKDKDEISCLKPSAGG